MDLSSSISSSVKESSSMSSSKISSSSVSSSSMSSKVSSSLTSAVSDISAEMDELLATAIGPRGGALTNISDRIGGLSLDDMMSSTSLSGGQSASSVSSSSSKQVTKMSSISQSSMELLEGGDSHCTSSVKQSSSSVASSASMASEQKVVDGKVVHAETVAEKASLASQSQKEKVVQDGQVLVDTGSKSETTSAGSLRATKEMSQAELDSFFKGNAAITGKPVEALNFDKDKNLFEITLADLPEFSPKELTVKIVGDVITVYGTHEEKIGDGFKTHSYVRRFTVPKGLKTDNIEWNLNPDGALAITAGDTVKGGKSQVHLDCTIFKPRSFFKSAQK